MFIITSVASAEVYKWEDTEVMYFTDNPSSVPEEYREKVYAENMEQNKSTDQQVKVEETNNQNRPVVTRKNKISVSQANLGQQSRVGVRSIQQHTRDVSVKNVENEFPSIASLFVIWFMIALFIIITWVYTIVDTIRSKFITPTIRAVWMLLVIFVPLIGLELYYILGVSQKCNVRCHNEKTRLWSHNRISTR
jgi:ATP-dependent Zn protease